MFFFLTYCQMVMMIYSSDCYHFCSPQGQSLKLSFKTLLRGYIVLSIFITMSNLVSNVAGKGPPALYFKHVSRALALQRDERVSSISDTAWDF